MQFTHRSGKKRDGFMFFLMGKNKNRYLKHASIKSLHSEIFCGDTCGAMVIVVGNGNGNTSPSPDCLSHCTNTFGRGMNPAILTPSIDKL